MRIALVTQEEPFYLPAALDRFCRSRGGETVAMVVLPAFNEPLKETARRLYDFYGPVDFMRLAGRFAWAAVADLLNVVRPVTRAYSARDVARRHGIRVYAPADVNASEFLDVLRDGIRPDLLVSIAASQVFKRALLEIPGLGCINLHSAPLPKYQGMMPNFWTLFHEEPEAAVTVHVMAEKLDAGDILVQKPVPIRPDDSLHDLMVRSKEVGVEALLEAVEQIRSGAAAPRAMDAARGSYFSFPTHADAAKLRARGRSLL